MALGKRLVLFVATNLAIIAMVSIVFRIFGLDGYLSQSGINHTSLLVMCLVWGMGASFISLLLSKKIAKWSMKVQIIDESVADSRLQDVRRTVHQLAAKAGLPKMPEVGYYQSQDVNAFATGPSKSNSLVAVSTGLLTNMNKEEVDGVLGHEIAHIANGDMVTMTLLQGVINAFVMYLARVVSYALANAMRGDNDSAPSYGIAHFASIMFFQFVFGLLGAMIVGTFSRWREFRADKGGAELAGRQKMIAALKKLSINSAIPQAKEPAGMASLKISGRSTLMALMSTHPPLEKRIERLQMGQL